jgi:hypothetical protein
MTDIEKVFIIFENVRFNIRTGFSLILILPDNLSLVSFLATEREKEYKQTNVLFSEKMKVRLQFCEL